MRVRVNGWVGVGIMMLFSVAGFAAPESDLRLVEAAERGDAAAVRALLGQKVDVNLSQADGTTALAWAVHRDDVGTADLLIRAGANVNAANEYGVTPLSLACTNRNAALVSKLLDAGANPNAAQWTGETPVMACARTGSVEGVRALLARGGDANATESQKGQTALMWAAAGKHADAARMLVERRADVNARSKTGFTSLMFAAQQGDVETARILLAAGANVNDATEKDGSALVVAAASGHEDVGILLLEKGANPNVTDSDGIAPLHYVAQEGMSAVSGVDNDYFLSYLFRPNLVGLAKSLLAHGANPNVRIQQPPSRLMLQYRPRLRLSGATPLFLAAATGDAELMRMLAAAGADPKLGTTANTTPLMAAAGMGRIERRTAEEEKAALEAVQVALELGNDIHATGERGMTALHGAALSAGNSIIQYLVDKGARINQQDTCGQTALSIAQGDPKEMVNRADRFKVYKDTVELVTKLGGEVLPFKPVAQCQHTRHNATKDLEFGEYVGLAPL
jgi:ankyrin repeat protein